MHKPFIVAVICDSTSIIPKYTRKRFSTFNNDLICFRIWPLDNGCKNVCLESTGKYYIPIYNILEDFISNLVVANPKWVKAINGRKDDNKDTKWIADLFKMGLIRSPYVASKDFRILRKLIIYRYKLTNTKSAQSIIIIILNNNNFSGEDITSCLRKKYKSSLEDILSSVNITQLTNEQKLRINIIILIILIIK